MRAVWPISGGQIIIHHALEQGHRVLRWFYLIKLPFLGLLYSVRIVVVKMLV